MHCCTVRLACLIHAASVRSEPGSNSPYKNYFVTDKFVCAFFYFFKKLNSRLIQIFLIKTQQCLLHCLNLTRAIRTIQFFKEHRISQSAVFHSLSFILKRSNEFLIYHSFQNFQAIFERFFLFFFHSEFCVSEFTCFNLELNDHRRFAARGLI